MFQLAILLSTSILFNCLLAYYRPFVEGYNMLLHYFNELSFFFYLCMCLTFTDFVDNVPTRQGTGSVLATYMFAILSVNVVICLFAFALTQKHLCEHWKVDWKSLLSWLPESNENILKRRVRSDGGLASDRKGLMDASSDFIIRRGDRDRTMNVEVDGEPEEIEPQKYQH